MNRENIYIFHCLFYCAISFIVYDNEKLKLKLIWKFIRLEFPPLFICRTKEGKKPHEFLQFSKHKTANERGICDVSNSSFQSVFQRSKLNKFIFVYVLFSVAQQAKICSKCHDTGNELLFLLDSIIIEINYSAPRFERFVSNSPFWLHSCIKFAAWFMHFCRAKCNKTERIMTKWTGNMRNFRDDVIKINLSSVFLLVYPRKT